MKNNGKSWLKNKTELKGMREKDQQKRVAESGVSGIEGGGGGEKGNEEVVDWMKRRGTKNLKKSKQKERRGGGVQGHKEPH